MEREKKGNIKRGGGKLKMEGKIFLMKMSNEQRTFFFCHFLKPLKFVWVVPKWKFLWGKNWEMGNFLTPDFTPGYAPGWNSTFPECEMEGNQLGLLSGKFEFAATREMKIFPASFVKWGIRIN